MDKKTYELIKMIEEYKEEYRDLLSETTDTNKQSRYSGAIEGFNAIINDLRDKHQSKPPDWWSTRDDLLVLMMTGLRRNIQ